MFPADRAHTSRTGRAGLAGFVAAALLVGLLPATVLAARPTAVADHASVPVNAPATAIDVLANDVGTGLTIASATDPANGSVVVAGDGLTLTYQPGADFHGTDTFDYAITDGHGPTDTGTVTVDANSPPVAVDDPGTACGPTSSWGGAFPIPEDYRDPNPVDQNYFILFGSCGLLHNDTDPDGDVLTYQIVSPPSHGEVLKIDEDFFGYRPAANYSTKPGDQPGGQWISDSFTYHACDAVSCSAPATMKYWVAPINDVPTFTPGADVVVGEGSGAYSGTWATNVSPGPPNESDQSVQFLPDGPGALTGTPGLFTVPPAIDATGHLTFTLAPGSSGSADATFVLKDDGGTLPDYTFGTPTAKADDTTDPFTIHISVTAGPVTAVNDTPTFPEDATPSPVLVDVLANDTYPGGSTITGVTQGTLGDVTVAGDGLSVLYAPHANANGLDTFTYTLDDGAGSTDTATVQLTLTPVNDDPVAAPDSANVSEDAAATAIPVLANDTDVDGDARTITAKTDGAHGVVVITGGGTGLTYQPNLHYSGSDSFTYTISDGHGGSAIGTVSMTISGVNNAPHAGNDVSVTVPESAGATGIAVMANDTDLDGDTLLITGKTNGAHGTVVITSGGAGLTYDPVQLYYGTDVFTYTISDGHGGSGTATVLLTVVKDTVKPVATAPSERFYNQTVGSTTTKAHITWGGSDTGGTGIASYKLQVSVNGGTYSTIGLASATSTAINRTLTDGRTYRYRVRATDRQGNIGAYVYGPTFSGARAQNTSTSLHYLGPWATSTNAKALGGNHRWSSSTSASVSTTKTVRDLAWVTTKTTTSGSAQVWIDGSLAATVNLHASSTIYRQLVFYVHFGTLSTHTIEIRPIGGGRVYLDAILVYR